MSWFNLLASIAISVVTAETIGHVVVEPLLANSIGRLNLLLSVF